MTLDFPLVIGGLFVGIIVGLTGMGGGALMTPMLVFFFGVDPLTAISSDIVVSLFMKPVGAAVHLRHGTVNKQLVLWLCLGSVPLAFMGAWLISLVPDGVPVDVILKRALGIALLISTGGLLLRAVMQVWNNRLPLGEGPAPMTRPDVVIRPIPTLLLGALAGLMVGLTSVGAGSIVVVVLLLLYPRLKASSLVGTDLAQAIPLVAAAALGHILFGSFSLALAASLLVGAMPGAFIGAQISSLKLLGVPDLYVSVAALAAVAFAFVGWRVVRNRIKRIPAVSMPGLVRPEIPSLQSADDRLPERDADSI